MNYNFTDNVRHALAAARREALRLNHDYVGTEHMLLGLFSPKGATAQRILERLGAGEAAIRERTESAVRRGKASLGLTELPYTSRAKKVLEFSMANARDLRDGFVGTEHLLLGLLCEEKGIAAQMLNASGVTLAKVEATLLALRAESGGLANSGVREAPAPRAADASGRWFLEVDAASVTPIYEQIIARIEEAVATGRLVVGQVLWRRG